MTHLVVTLPLKIESTANVREHWRRKAERARVHRMWGRSAFGVRHPFGITMLAVRPEPPLSVTMTRIAPRELDSDNLAISFKSVRDGIADWLGVNDNDRRIEWKYAQERGAPKHYAARIEIQAAVSRMDARTQASASESQPQGATE